MCVCVYMYIYIYSPHFLKTLNLVKKKKNSLQEVSETSTGTTWKTASSVPTQLAVFKRTTGNEPASNLSGTSKGQMAASPWGLRDLI